MLQLFGLFHLVFCFYFRNENKNYNKRWGFCQLLSKKNKKKEKIFTIVPHKICLPVVFSILKHIQITGIELTV